VVRLLSEIPQHEHGAYVFSTTDGRVPISGFTKNKKRIDDAVKAAGHEIAPWTIHDLRRTAATGMGALGVAPHVIELVLNHISGTRAGVAGIYQRAEMLPERRRALEQWAHHVERLTGQVGMLRAVA
jgi:integrase